jgi:hypothetical protein
MSRWALICLHVHSLPVRIQGTDSTSGKITLKTFTVFDTHVNGLHMMIQRVSWIAES